MDFFGTDRAGRRNAMIVLACVIGISLACICVGFALCATARDSAVEDGAAAIQESILEAAEQCYAIEGAYPPSLDYLVKHYGIQVNEQSYSVTYSIFGSNIQPVVMVKPR